MTEKFDFAQMNQQEADTFPPEKTNLTGHKATEARLCAVQALFQARLMDEQIKLVKEQFLLHEVGVRGADKKIFKELMDDLDQNAQRYHEMVTSYLKEEWPAERVDAVAFSVLMVAIAELFCRANAPTKVVLNEYINIAKGFVKPDEVRFVNGVLDAAAKVVRPQA